jgi:TatD DNase family protein
MSDAFKEYPPVPKKLDSPVMDSHCHLDITENFSVSEALSKAEQVGVCGIMQVGCDVASSEWSVKTARENSKILASVAIHPNEAPVIEEKLGRTELTSAIKKIAELATDSRVRAIGETGLDFFRTSEQGLAAQEFSFREHIKIANELNKPVMVHDRDAHEDVLRVLLQEQAKAVVFHCYSADADFARRVSELGWYLSFAGTITFKNAPKLREALEVTPLDNILVETDAPFLTPTPYRGQTNASYLIPVTLRFMAEHLQKDEDELAKRVHENFLRIFGSFE